MGRWNREIGRIGFRETGFGSIVASIPVKEKSYQAPLRFSFPAMAYADRVTGSNL